MAGDSNRTRQATMIMQLTRRQFDFGYEGDASVITHPRLRALYDLWQDKRGSRQAPSRRDFAVEELKPWFGHLMVLDCLEDDSFRYRLYGTELARMFGFDLTGHTVDSVADRIGPRPDAEYRQVRRIGAPLHVSRSSPSAKDYLLVDKLALPLMEAGEVTKILAAIYPSP